MMTGWSKKGLCKSSRLVVIVDLKFFVKPSIVPSVDTEVEDNTQFKNTWRKDFARLSVWKIIINPKVKVFKSHPKRYSNII